MEWPTSAFWDYSLDLYRRPGVEAACLELQGRHGLDVNVLLLCCWLGKRGISLDPGALARVRQLSEGWQAEVVRPLRAIRRHLKISLDHPHGVVACLPDLAGALRAEILSVALDAEHVEQLALAEALSDLPARAAPGAKLVAENLASCWRFGEPDRGPLRTLLRAACPEADDDGLDVIPGLPFYGG